MQPPRAAGNLRIDGKEWKHMAWKFLAQDCSSNLSAPVHFWHCPSCLQSLRDLMLSDQPECLWLTFAMELLALTLTGVLLLMWKLLGSSQIPERSTSWIEVVLLIGLECVHRQIFSQFYSDERVLFIPLLSKVRAACRGMTAAIIIHQPWAHIHWIWIIPWGTSGVKYVGTIYLFLCLSLKEKWQQLCCFEMCHPEKFHEPPVFLTTVKLMSVWTLIEWAFKNICDCFLSAVCQRAAADTAIKRFLYEQSMSQPEVEHL